MSIGVHWRKSTAQKFMMKKWILPQNILHEIIVVSVILILNCSPVVSDFCNLNPERGPCSNYTMLNFYNRTSRRCERFWYGGCEGNDNRFSTSEECLVKCSGRKTDDFCSLNPERGPCSNYTVLNFYNSTSRQCERFWYGGCEGNDNRFSTREECHAKCSGRKTNEEAV